MPKDHLVMAIRVLIRVLILVMMLLALMLIPLAYGSLTLGIMMLMWGGWPYALTGLLGIIEGGLIVLLIRSIKQFAYAHWQELDKLEGSG